ncbi:hypothetical protein GGR98_003183 [Parageobacillus caldoxylosilyticus]|nr:hypothetical protein [Parageobacillus caldoxylosilyticus]MBB3853889.1 hypothetical protein [Parageobacillus caldoxylosilyticus]
MVIMEHLAQILLAEPVPNSTEGGVDLVAKIVVVYGPMEGMVHDRRRR